MVASMLGQTLSHHGFVLPATFPRVNHFATGPFFDVDLRVGSVTALLTCGGVVGSFLPDDPQVLVLIVSIRSLLRAANLHVLIHTVDYLQSVV
jgi:hypothetical protein